MAFYGYMKVLVNLVNSFFLDMPHCAENLVW